MHGPGRYDDLCTQARTAARAAGALLIVLDGARGSGFSVQVPLPMLVRLPGMLRLVADQIEADLGQPPLTPPTEEPTR